MNDKPIILHITNQPNMLQEAAEYCRSINYKFETINERAALNSEIWIENLFIWRECAIAEETYQNALDA